MAHVAEYKKRIVENIVKLAKEYPIVGAVNMENLPAPQLQAMKAQLRGKVVLVMTKKRLIKIALEKLKSERKDIEKLEEHLNGMPALIFTGESPFKLSRILQKNKSKAPAKGGQIAPRDIMVNKGSTGFAPGPIIGELGMVGIKTGVEGGKVAVKEDTVVVRQGEQIKPKVAEILTRLGIEPMEVGLDLMAAYENGLVYTRDILTIDDQQYLSMLNNAAKSAFNLSLNAAYPTKDNIQLLISKAFNDSRALGLSQEIIDSGIVEELLAKAERSLLSLKNTAKIDVPEKISQDGKETEAKKEAKAKHKKAGKISHETDKKVEALPEEKEKFPQEEVKKEEAKDAVKNKEEEIVREELDELEHDILKNKEEKEREQIEDLTKELVRKGTLRK